MRAAEHEDVGLGVAQRAEGAGERHRIFDDGRGRRDRGTDASGRVVVDDDGEGARVLGVQRLDVERTGAAADEHHEEVAGDAGTLKAEWLSKHIAPLEEAGETVTMEPDAPAAPEGYVTPGESSTPVAEPVKPQPPPPPAASGPYAPKPPPPQKQ